MIPFADRARRLLSTPKSRRTRRASSFRPEAAVECLEGRALLSAGDLMWQNAANLFPGQTAIFLDATVQNDGKIVAVGVRYGTDADFLVVRYTAGGQLDSSFGVNGIVTRAFQADSDDTAVGVVIDPDGRIVVGGTTISNDNIKSIALTRFNRDGSLDTTYGLNGLTIEDYPANDVTVSGMTIDHSGRVYVVGTKQHASDPVDGLVARFNFHDGRKDNSFDVNGFKEVLGAPLIDVAVDAQNRPVVLGTRGEVARFTTAGAFDSTFSSDGIAIIDSFDVAGTPITRAIAIAPDGKIVVAGHSGGQFQAGVARLLANGNLDNSFSDNGKFSFNPTSGDDYLTDVLVLAGGRIVVGGYDGGTDKDWTVAAITPTGRLDSNFGGGGFVRYPVGGTDALYGLTLTNDGHVVAVGSAGVLSKPLKGVVVQIEGTLGRRDDLLGWTDAGLFYAARSTGETFENHGWGTLARNVSWKDAHEGDFNGDGFTDIVARDGTGYWWLGLNSGRGATFTATVRWNEGAQWRDVRFADLNGDGMTDIVGRTYYGEWWASYGFGTFFGTPRRWDGWNEAAGWRDVLAADFNGDNRADLAGRTSYGEWWVSLSNGVVFNKSAWGNWAEAAGWRDVTAADFNGDGRADIAGRTSTGLWFVARSTGTAFAMSQWAAWNETLGWKDVRVGDFNRDGRADLVARNDAGEIFVGATTFQFNNPGNPYVFTFTRWGAWNEAALWRDVTVGDFDGDGRADLAGRTYTGAWYVARSTGAVLSTSQWGQWNEAAGWTVFSGDFVSANYTDAF